MESPQSIVSPFKASSVFSEPENRNLDLFPNQPKPKTKNPESFLGVLDVYIHQARDIQNICIYHKQDVYAKICITSHPEKSLTTQTVNGGGKNPVFNETLQINIPSVNSVNSSLKCEIFMLSRVRNYLQDQLLGFALIPLSEILVKNGKLEKEFTLSSTDLFHSPSGFVDLSLSYTGVSPDVIAVAPPPPAASGTAAGSDLADFEKLEFPDPKIVNENNIMVTEYFGLVSSDTEDQSDVTVLKTGTPKTDSSFSSVSTNGSECASDTVIETETDSFSKSVNQELDLANIDLDQKIVQQDFVDLYMKSMQQFTESLAKMKLPLDMENGRTDSGNSGSGQTGSGQTGSGRTGSGQTPTSTPSRVFYGSRAFF